MLPKLEIAAEAAVLPARDYPGAVLTNGVLADLMAGLAAQSGRSIELSTPAFPRERLGILERGVLDASLSSRDLAAEAARRAFAMSDLQPSAFRCVIVSSVTPDKAFPALATTVQTDLGFDRSAMAFDLSIGCNGFLVGLDLAARVLANEPVGAAAIVVGAETMVRTADASDRTVCTIFGDGAGAVILRRSETQRMHPVQIWTLGDQGPRIEMRSCLPGAPDIPRFVARDGLLGVEPDRLSRQSIALEGKRVYRDMVRNLPGFISAYLDREHLSIEDVDRFLFHQANGRMLEAIAGPSGLGIRPERVLSNIDRVGNTASASLPILLAQAAQAGDIVSGDRVLFIGFGSGYSIGAMLLEWK